MPSIIRTNQISSALPRIHLASASEIWDWELSCEAVPALGQARMIHGHNLRQLRMAKCRRLRRATSPWCHHSVRPRRLQDRTSRRRSEEHTSELQSHHDLVCRLLLEKKKINK